MKILLTGMTNIQCGKISQRRQFVNVKDTYFAILEKAGHSVDWRPAKPFENTSAYDVVLVGIGNIGEFSCTHLYNALSLFENKHVAFYVDDWKVNVNIGLVEGGDIWRKFVYENNVKAFGSTSLLKRERKYLDEVRQGGFEGFKLLATCFEWGNHGLLIQDTTFRPKDFWTFDPSPFVMKEVEYGGIGYSNREKQWVCASIADYSKKVSKWGLKWPVQYFTKKNFMSEHDLVQSVYARSWGVIAPPYKASGSGWWRGRYNDAMSAGCILLAAPHEIAELGGEFREVSHFPNEVEALNGKKLSGIANQQYWQFTEKMPSSKDVIKKINNFLGEIA